MKVIIGFICGFLISAGLVLADNISSPPPIKDPTIAHYFKQIYDNFHRLQVVTTNPDGVRNGKKGDMVLLQTGGNHYIEINTDSSTQWRGVSLLDTP